MLQKDEIERIERYINGTGNPHDIIWVETLFSKGSENPGLRSQLEEDWEVTLSKNSPSDANLRHLLDSVHHKIREKEARERRRIIHRITTIYSKAAAILLFPLIVAGAMIIGYRTQSSLAGQAVNSVIHAPMGSRVSFNLPDGTTGWLNSGSTLSYSQPFTTHRKVALQGEAWFDVTHDAKKPFEINTGKSLVKVLGTSFSVSAYHEEQYVEVVLLNGKVEFSDLNHSKTTTMLPSERLVFRDGSITVTTTEPLKYKAWTDGKLVFRGDNMAEVARRIERWYNVKVELTDQELNKFSFRGTFEDDSLEEVLRLLGMTSPIGYKIIPRQQNPNGTYQKEKVILFKRTKQKQSI